MYNFLVKRGQLVAFLLGLVLTIIFLAFIVGGVGKFNQLGPEERVDSNIFNFGLWIAILLIVLCALTALLFGLFHLVTHLKGSIKFIVGVGVLLLIFLIAYFTADPAAGGGLAETLDRFNIGPRESRFISAALWTTLILLGLAVLAFIVSELRNLLK